jgi:hypothetical protein
MPVLCCRLKFWYEAFLESVFWVKLIMPHLRWSRLFGQYFLFP